LRHRGLATALALCIIGATVPLFADEAPLGSDLPATDGSGQVSGSKTDTQEATATPAGSDLPTERIVPASDVLPAAYRAEKKPPENFFRRFEIIAFGSYPISLLYTNFCFSMATFVENDFDATYAPWPFNSSSVDTTTTDEHFVRMGVAACLSLAIAGADAIIRAVEDGRSRAGELDSGVGPH
jgi:hypothetical protein